MSLNGTGTADRGPSLPSRLNPTQQVISLAAHILTITAAFTPALVIAALVVTLSAILVLVIPAIHWLPKPGEAGTFLGGLLGAQAAIAALTLAVTLFVMQGVSARRDVDDRVYLEYIRRSWVRAIFWGSMGAVGITGAVLMTEKFISETGEMADAILGLRNLALIAVLAFLTNLGLAGALFERAINLTRPEQWRSLRRHVNERDVRQAVQIFLRRRQRAVAALEANEPDITSVFPDSGEGSADEAVRALLDDARRAMAERRQGEFEKSIDSIRGLITPAMDEIEKAGLSWSPPGEQPEWPPLRELGRNLYPFREEVIREGSREYVFQLQRLDYWLAITGLRRRCGELFTTGLNGYRWNYQITSRSGGGEFHDMIRDRFSVISNSLTLGSEPEESFSYTREIVKNQERMLSDAMHMNRPQDYGQLHNGFNPSLQTVLWRLERDKPRGTKPDLQRETLEQDYRIALLGLAGRAAALAEAGRIPDAIPYMDLARGFYTHIGPLGQDIAQVFARSERFGFSQWSEWEMQDQTPGQAYTSYPEQYPLAFFAVRLMELASDSMPALNLRGNANQILDWFLAHSERLEHYVEENPNLTVEQRRELATKVLQEAVLNDEIEEEREVIGRGINSNRVATFTSQIREIALSTNSIEHLFQEAGTFTQLYEDDAEAPEERGYYELLPKSPFMDSAENDRTYCDPIEGEQWGRSLSKDAVHLLCEALEDATQTTARLDSQESLLQAAQAALEELTPENSIGIVLAGDWGDTRLAFYGDESEGYQPYWYFEGSRRTMEIGRYRGHPILEGPSSGEPRLYIVDPNTWGRYVRTPFADGQPLKVEVKLISLERAQEMLQGNKALFEDLPDFDSKLRKLQTYVEVAIGIRHQFIVADQSRARKIISTGRSSVAHTEP